ncbi:MAG TPA: helix-turn-helix domain-containing protein [Acidimicrobiales bacterium]|nr:helix-turn-helix domain-containing protein [Acidimicrobiales bacterium]
MPSASDTYTAAQAAELLGVSERRIRQLVAEGKLPGRRGTDGVVRIRQQAVNEERKKRRASAPRKAAATPRAARAAARPAPVDVDELAQAVASAVGQRIEGQLEITRKAESLVRQELDEERARRMQVEAQLSDAQQKIAELESRAGRGGLFGRRRRADT